MKTKKKRDRSLSKIVDFRSLEQKQRAQELAELKGTNLKNWIEQLITEKTK